MRYRNLILGIFCLILFFQNQLFGQTQYRTFRQPNGKSFQAAEAGYCCQLQWLETPEGHVVTIGKDGYFHYTIMDEQGNFSPVNEKVGIQEPISTRAVKSSDLEFKNKIQKKVDAFNAAAHKNREKFLALQGLRPNRLSKSSPASTKAMANQTTITIGAILVEFDDLEHHVSGSPPIGYTKEDFEDMLFSDDEYDYKSPDEEDVSGSLKDYYQKQSHGLLQIDGEVINPAPGGVIEWLNVDHTSNYSTTSSGQWTYVANDDLPEAAIDSANAKLWNIDYQIILVIVGGIGDTWINMATTHLYVNDSGDHLGACVFQERCNLEWTGTQNIAFTHIGIWAHETGHLFGHGLATAGHHIGGGPSDWCSMGVGYRTGPLRKGASPSDHDPIERILLGWAEPTIITSNLINESVSYIEEETDTTETMDFYQFTCSDPSVKFVVENRQYLGFNSYLPEWWESGTKGGLLVWRCPYLTYDYNRVVVPADNNTDVVLEGMPHVSDGDLGDPYPGDTQNQSITMSTTPNTDWDSKKTGFAITNISSSSSTMTANFYPNYWSGTITQNTTWSGEVYIGGNVTVDNNATLTINSGATIKFGGNYNITVKAGSKILANGTSANHIKFTKNTSNWGGVIVNGSNNQFKYCDFEYSSNDGLKLYGSPSQASNNKVEYCSFENNDDAGLVIINNYGPDIKHCRDINNNTLDGISLDNNDWVEMVDTWVISNNRHGVYSKYSDLLLWECLMKNNSSIGIYSYHDYYLDLSYYDSWGGGNSIHDNNWGVAIYYYDDDDDVNMDWDSELPNSIYDNSGYEVQIKFSGSVCVDADEVFWGTGATYDGCVSHDDTVGSDQTGLPKGGTVDFPVFTPRNNTGGNPKDQDADIPEEELKEIINNEPNSVAGVDALRKLHHQVRKKAYKTKNRALETEFVDYLEALYTSKKNTMVGKKVLTYLVRGKMRQDKYTESIELCKEGLEVLDSNNLQTVKENLAWLYIHTRQYEKAQAALTDLRTSYGDIPECSDYIDHLGKMLTKNMERDNLSIPEALATESTSSDELDLSQNYPNPGNPTTTIHFRLPEANRVVLRVVNILGQEVKTLVNDHREAGSYTVIWDGKNNRGLSVPSGIYLYTLKAGDKVVTKKLMLLK